MSLKEAGFQPRKFGKFLNYVFFSEQDFDTNTLVLIKDGYLVYERYTHGFKAQQPHRAWSVTKSITNALVGIASKKGLLTKEDSIGKFHPAFQTPKRKSLSINHLLRMSSGLRWKEGYEYDPLESDVIAMLYTTHFHDMASLLSSKSFAHPPGYKFRYSSGETNLLVKVLRESLPAQTYDDFPWKELFDPLQITTATWERDAAGTFIGSSYLYISPRDLARFGLFFLRDGVWKGNRILPEKWVEYSTTPAPAFARTILSGKANCKSYGAQWWLNTPTKEKKCDRPYPDAPSSIYMASGHHGQSLIIMPEQKIVLVRNASDKKSRIDRNLYLKLLLESLKP
ncbi:serine hydrolase [bacterium]|jgi:CubicO group peptidase (beta-lactamase class C family)|nr:serine hydrolase [bacterium]